MVGENRAQHKCGPLHLCTHRRTSVTSKFAVWTAVLFVFFTQNNISVSAAKTTSNIYILKNKTTTTMQHKNKKWINLARGKAVERKRLHLPGLLVKKYILNMYKIAATLQVRKHTHTTINTFTQHPLARNQEVEGTGFFGPNLKLALQSPINVQLLNRACEI